MKRLVAVSLIAVFAALRVVRAEPFKDGETVCFIGDSITHGGPYHAFIRAYYLTRFPDQTIQFVNAGTSGETAGGGAARFDEDVLPYRPTSAVVMFGMNDVNRGAYVANPDEEASRPKTSSGRISEKYGEVSRTYSERSGRSQVTVHYTIAVRRYRGDRTG